MTVYLTDPSANLYALTQQQRGTYPSSRHGAAHMTRPPDVRHELSDIVWHRFGATAHCSCGQDLTASTTGQATVAWADHVSDRITTEAVKAIGRAEASQ